MRPDRPAPCRPFVPAALLAILASCSARPLQDAASGPAAPPDSDPSALRLAVRVSKPAAEHINPLVYRGGFIPKSLVFETLVRRDAEGRIVPGLAEAWRFEDSGRSLILTLRAGARFQDGSPVDAQAVADHFERWARLPEHAWLSSTDRIVAIEVLSPFEVKLVTDRPASVLTDLVAINPTAVRAPAMVDSEGNFVRPLGSGPFEFCGVDRSERVFRYRPAAGAGNLLPVELHAYAGTEPSPVDELLRGKLDILADGWYQAVPRARIAELRRRSDVSVLEGPGSVVVYLSFRFEAGPTADRDVRRRVAAAIRRDELIERAEQGLADPCFGFAAPTVTIWPVFREPLNSTPASSSETPVTLVLLVSAEGRGPALGAPLAEQLRAAGFSIELSVADGDDYGRRVESGAYDLRLETTWGVPYDPYISLVNRFLAPSRDRTAAERRSRGVDPELADLVRQVTAAFDPEQHPALYARIQQRIDQEALLVPLYVPKRLALIRAGVTGLRLDHDLYHLDLSAVRK